MDGRVVLAIGGEDREGFLNDLVSNDIARRDGLTWSALLSPQGKYLADFFTWHGEWQGAPVIFLDVAAALAPDLLRRLTLYRLRRKVSFAETGLPVARGTGPLPEGAMADPRHPEMGWRAYGEGFADDATDWDALRVALLVPETGIELIPDESYLLELGVDRLNGVDFRKGCYVGQEVTARMKHKTELKKGLARVRIEGDAEPGTPITTPDGKPAGTLHTRAGSEALAYLRFDRATGEMQAGAARLSRIA